MEIARNIGADYVISGEVYLIEEQYILSLKIHDTQGGHLLGREEVKGLKLTELFDEATVASTQLVVDALDILLMENTSTQKTDLCDSGKFTQVCDSHGPPCILYQLQKLSF